MAFKPDINDLRASAALKIALTLNSEGYEVIAVEPNIKMHNILKLVSIKEALMNSDIIAILVNHEGFYATVNQKRLNK